MDVLQIQTLVILLLIILLGNHTRVQIQVHLCYITFSAIRSSCEFCNGYYTNEGSIGLFIRANELLTSTNNTVDQLEKLFSSDCSVTPLIRIWKEIGALVSSKKKNHASNEEG